MSMLLMLKEGKLLSLESRGVDKITSSVSIIEDEGEKIAGYSQARFATAAFGIDIERDA